MTLLYARAIKIGFKNFFYIYVKKWGTRGTKGLNAKKYKLFNIL